MKNVPTNLSNLKSKGNKLDVDKLVPAPVDLSKLSDIVKNDVVKKDVCNSKIKNIEDKIPDITNLVTNTILNATINEVKVEIPSITNLAATFALNDHDHDRCFTTKEFNKLTAESFTARLAQANLAGKNGIANLVKKTDLNKNELNELSKKVKAIPTKVLTKDLINKFSILYGAKYFSSGIFQSYLVLIPAKKYIKYFSGTTKTDLWKSSGMSEENIENITKSDSNFAPTFVDHHLLPHITFNGHCIIKNNKSISKKLLKMI